MQELSLHILDMVENSLRAKAKFIEIKVRETDDELVVEVKDDGEGMDGKMLRRVSDPFVTTKSAEKVGLGLSLLRQSALSCNGEFKIRSAEGKGTCVRVVFKYSHIDRPPMGDLKTTILGLIVTHPDRDFWFYYKKSGREFVLDTREIKRILGPEIKINHPEVISYLDRELEGVGKK